LTERARISTLIRSGPGRTARAWSAPVRRDRRPRHRVAKTAFRTASHAIPVRRGEATRPLYITAAGLEVEEAATLVADMAGTFRLPDALRRVDALSRSLPSHGKLDHRDR
jgi:hypothetical protein